MKFAKLTNILSDYAQEIIDSKSNGYKFRSRAYKRVVDLIDRHYEPSETVTKEKIAKLELTPYMTGNITKVAKGESLPKIKGTKKKTPNGKRPIKKPQPKLLKTLTSLMGIGEEKANKLIDKGLQSMSQLHMKKWLKELPEETRAYMSLKPIKEITHDEITKLEPIIMRFSNNYRKLYLVGSYRRKKRVSKDIDVMLVSKDENAIGKLLKDMQATALEVYPYSQGKDKMSMILKLNKSRVYKIDVFRVLPEHKIPMLLYSTGSKEHNIKMRRIAKKLGYKLNQKGLFKEDKLVDGLKKESDYFKILKIDYLPPEDRI
jgi:DNA polymerase (family 10)